MKLTRYVPWIAGGLALAAALVGVVPPGKTRGFDLDAFGRLPVLEGGRVKPIDTVARNSLLMIRSKQSLTYSGRTVGPDEWLLDVMFRPEVADRQPVFVIDDPEVLGLLGLKQSSERYYPFTALASHLDEIQRQAQAAHAIDAKQRTRFQSAIANLFERVYLYYRLKNTVQLEGTPGLAALIMARGAQGAAERSDALVQLGFFRPLPPPASEPGDNWRSIGAALKADGAESDVGLLGWARLAAAYAAQDEARFNAALADIGKVDAA